MAGELDHPQRQPSARERRRPEGRRPPGLVGLARHHHDRALFRRAAAGRPRRGQAARLADLPRHPISARQADARTAGGFPRLQGRAELSFAHQGRRRRRFLHRLGRPRRGADFVLLADAGLRARAWLGDRPPGRPHGGADRRRRARRRQHLRGDPRRLEAGPAQLLVDHRLQPPEPRRRGARGTVGALRAAVPEFRLGRGDREIRLAAAGRVQGAGRRQASPLDRQLPEPALFGAGVRRRRRLAQAPERRDRRPGRRHAPDRKAQRRRAGRADEQSRRPRFARRARSLPRRHHRQADLLHLLHHQGLRPAVRRPQGQPRRADDAGADGRLPARPTMCGAGTNGTSSRD